MAIAINAKTFQLQNSQDSLPHEHVIVDIGDGRDECQQV